MSSRNILKKFPFEHNGFLLFSSIFLGIFLRAFNFFKNNPLEYDEAVIWKYANFPLKDIISGNYFDFRFHPPLFYLLIHYWRKISDVEMWLRIPSFLASIISVLLIYNFLKNLFNRKIAVFGTFLYSLSPFSIWWSSQLRVYSLLFLISLVFLIAYIKILENNRKIFYWLIFFTIGMIGFHMDYSFIWIFLTVNLHFILFTKNKKDNKLPRWFLVNFLIILNFSLYIILIYLYIRSGRITIENFQTMNWWMQIPNLIVIPKVILEMIFSTKLSYFWYNRSVYIFVLTRIVGLFTLLLVLKALFIRNKKKCLISIIILFPVSTSFAISQVYPIFISRNLFIVSLGVIALLSLVFYQFRKFPRFLNILLILWLFCNIIIVSRFYSEIPDWSKVKPFLKYYLSSDGEFYFLPAQFRESFEYYNYRYGFLTSNNQEIIRSNSKQIFDRVIRSKNKNHCVIYDLNRYDQIFSGLSKENIINYFESYPYKLDLNGGIKIYCRRTKET